MKSRPPVENVALWTLTIIGALTMGLAGASKFTSATMWHSHFAAWGYPVWSASLVGALEIISATLLLVPRAALYAACTLIVLMLGALFTVLTKPGELGWTAALIQLTIMTTIAVLRLRYHGAPC
jgi:uncharacterized membrane protein YphA (DoxX/SURF4 family)